MTGNPLAIRLENHVISLEPIADAHFAGLAEEARDPAIWRHTPLMGGTFESYWETTRADQAAGTQVPFAVRRKADGALVGMTRLFEISTEHRRCEIGYTWYAPSVWGTDVNPAAKRLLLGHCFETWDARRVQFLTDNLNARSQAAIAKLGAVREGVLRAHRIRPDGSRRDSVVFSIIAEEWPAVRENLDRRLAAT